MPPTCLFGKSMHMRPLITFCPSTGTGAMFQRGSLATYSGVALANVPLTDSLCSTCPRGTFWPGPTANLDTGGHNITSTPTRINPPASSSGFDALTLALANAYGDALPTPTPCTPCGGNLTTPKTGATNSTQCGASGWLECTGHAAGAVSLCGSDLAHYYC